MRVTIPIHTLAIGLSIAGIALVAGVIGHLPLVIGLTPGPESVEGEGALSVLLGGLTLFALSEWPDPARRRLFLFGICVLACAWILLGMDAIILSTQHASIAESWTTIPVPLGVKAGILVMSAFTLLLSLGFISRTLFEWSGFLLVGIGLLGVFEFAWGLIAAPHSSIFGVGMPALAGVAYVILGIALTAIGFESYIKPKTVDETRANTH